MTVSAFAPIVVGMATLHGSLRFLRLFVVPILLVVISVHAVTPLGQPLQRVAGSAFSAETADVSLRSGQRNVVVKQGEVPRQPAVPLATVWSTGLPPLAAAVPAAKPATRGLGSTGPPLTARISFGPLSPRAPPAA